MRCIQVVLATRLLWIVGLVLPMRRALSVFAALLLAPLIAHAADAPPFDAQGRPNRYQPGPWDSDVLVFRVSPDGQAERLATFERAGVPTVARLKDGRLIAAHQHFPENSDADFDKVAVRFSADDGRNWTVPQVIRVAGLPEGMRFPFDPTLVPLPDGRVRLYFTGNMGRTFQRSTPAIHSAIATDGVNYTYEPGVRFAVAGRMVIDCSVVLHNGLFHLYAPDNGVQMQPGRPPGNQRATDRPRLGIGYHATSPDGLDFTRVDDVQIDGRRRWLGNAQSDGQVITFFGTGDPGPSGFPGAGRPGGGMWMGVSRDGQAFRLTPAPLISVADPGAVAARDGGWIVVGTGPPRRGTRRFPNGDRPGPLPPEAARRQPGFGNPPGPPGGLQSHQVHSATSPDGLQWTRDEGVRVASASVPCAINDGDRRVLLYFVRDMTPRDWGTTAPVPLPDGRLRLYAFEQRVPVGNAVRSFVSTNGLDWTAESGERLRARADEQITDPFVIPWRGGWKMYFKSSPARDGLPKPRPGGRFRPLDQAPEWDDVER